MSYIAAKCPSCGAGIQVPDEMQRTFCSYCGSSIVSEEAIKLNKVQVVGTVEVAGIATLDRLIQNAESNMMINEFERAHKIFVQITENYPDDYRGWWGLLRSYTGEFTNINFASDNSLIPKWYKNTSTFIPSEEKRLAIQEIYENFKARIVTAREIEALQKNINADTSSTDEFGLLLLAGAIVFTIIAAALIILYGFEELIIDNPIMMMMIAAFFFICWVGYFRRLDYQKKEKVKKAKYQEVLRKAKDNYSELEGKFSNITHLYMGL